MSPAHPNGILNQDADSVAQLLERCQRGVFLESPQKFQACRASSEKDASPLDFQAHLLPFNRTTEFFLLRFAAQCRLRTGSPPSASLASVCRFATNEPRRSLGIPSQSERTSMQSAHPHPCQGIAFGDSASPRGIPSITCRRRLPALSRTPTSLSKHRAMDIIEATRSMMWRRSRQSHKRSEGIAHRLGSFACRDVLRRGECLVTFRRLKCGDGCDSRSDGLGELSGRCHTMSHPCPPPSPLKRRAANKPDSVHPPQPEGEGGLRSFILRNQPGTLARPRGRTPDGQPVGPLFDLAPRRVCLAPGSLDPNRWALTPPFHYDCRITANC